MSYDEDEEIAPFKMGSEDEDDLELGEDMAVPKDTDFGLDEEDPEHDS